MLRVIKAPNKKLLDIYTGPHHQLEYQHCWEPWLNNPLLNNLYKNSISHTERWYLEIRRLINEELWYHPLLNSIILDQSLKTKLVMSSVLDGASMRSVLANDMYPEYHISAGINLKKLNRWCSFFVSLPTSHKILVSLNAQSLD
jgi:hypothetical protein